MPNALADETSPYLQQHADNPVDWLPWGDEAFALAREQDKPIFLSVGYSSCHWCHVMAHESFEDEEIAAYLNERYVTIKVDREERPDVDAVYMDAVQALTGRGGWPMSVFLTPEGKPFHAGTYWPREPHHNMPSFPQVITAVYDAWTTKRDEVDGAATSIATRLAEFQAAAAADAVDLGVADAAVRVLVDRAWDRRLGGFGMAPKFPQAMTIEFLLDHHLRSGAADALEAAVHSLEAMGRGGIYDHVVGGFARYSTDARWLAPHFEKMLYDNALLAPAYAKAFAITGEPSLARTAAETCDYLLAEMRHHDGGFYSATDADSEGVEGKFFTWSLTEFTEVVAAAGADPERFSAFFGVVDEGNWEGVNILHEPVARAAFCADHDLDRDAFDRDLATVKVALHERREQRVHPGLDDKILTSWNALAIRGLARTGALLADDRYVAAAVAAAEFLAGNLVVDGALHHTWKDGRASVPAFLEDVALLSGASLDLYAVTGDVRWFDQAVALAEDAVARFHDDEAGAYFQTSHDAEALFARPKDTWDNAQPSGNSVLAEVFVKLAAYTGEAVWHRRGDEILRVFATSIEQSPTGFGYALQVVEFLAAGPREIAIVGSAGADRDALAALVHQRPLPGTVVAVAAPGDDAMARIPLLADRTEVDGAPAAYVCHDFVCQRPVTDPADLIGLLTSA